MVVPEAVLERGSTSGIGLGPALGEAAADAKRVQPERLDLDRLPDPRCDDPVAHLGVHPGELDAGLACREQPVVVGADAVSSTSSVARQNRLDGVLEQLAVSLRDALRELEKIVDGHHVPERGVDGVELRCLAVVREAVRQHALRHRTGPLEKNRTRVVESTRRETEAAERDERVASPVGEPRVARDDRLSAPAPDEVSVRGPVKASREAPAPSLFGDANGREILCRRVSLDGERPHRFALRQVPAEDSGRREILDVVEPACAFFGVQEVSIPIRLMRVSAVRRDDDRRQAGVGPEDDAPARHLGVEAEGGVLVMERVVVASGQERPDGKRSTRSAEETPVETRRCATGLDDQAVLDVSPIRQHEYPRRPGIRAERLDSLRTVGMDHIRRISLRRERERLARAFEPGLEAVHQDHSPGGWRGRGQEDRMVAPRPNPADRARAESPEAVRFEPLGAAMRKRGRF